MHRLARSLYQASSQSRLELLLAQMQGFTTPCIQECWLSDVLPGAEPAMLLYSLLLHSSSLVMPLAAYKPRSCFPVTPGEEGTRWTADDPAELGWQETVCLHFPLQCMGQAILPRPCQVRNLSWMGNPRASHRQWVMFAPPPRAHGCVQEDWLY